MKRRNFTPRNATIWTESMILFLRENFRKLTNQQLADQLGLRLTVTRNKCKELGLKRIEMEYWTDVQIDYLRENFRSKGDVELAEIFQKRWPKNKIWTKSHISKKRKYLKLIRTREEARSIFKAHVQPGGRSYTIDRNSASLNLPDNYVVQKIAWRNPELQKELLHYPELIDLKRKQILLERAVKQVRHGAK